MKGRRQFTQDFKRDAVSLVTDQNYRTEDAAASLNVAHSTLSRWIREYKNNMKAGSTVLTPTNTPSELATLRVKVKTQGQEIEILKKALPLFIRKTV